MCHGQGHDDSTLLLSLIPYALRCSFLRDDMCMTCMRSLVLGLRVCLSCHCVPSASCFLFSCVSSSCSLSYDCSVLLGSLLFYFLEQEPQRKKRKKQEESKRVKKKTTHAHSYSRTTNEEKNNHRIIYLCSFHFS